MLSDRQDKKKTRESIQGMRQIQWIMLFEWNSVPNGLTEWKNWVGQAAWFHEHKKNKPLFLASSLFGRFLIKSI